MTFPSADTAESAITFRKVDGIYAKGKARTNEIEAKAVVAEIVRRLRDPFLCQRSLGVVTLNSEQQRLIEDLLDRERMEDPELERFFGPTLQEPVFVKNLETVQGDQRDVVLLSVGYGPTEPEARTVSMNFGPLNRQGGERRVRDDQPHGSIRSRSEPLPGSRSAIEARRAAALAGVESRCSVS